MPVSHITIPPEEAGQKLLQFLQRRVGKDVPGSALMRVIRKGQVRVDGRRAKPFDRIMAGQVVRIPPFARRPAGPDSSNLETSNIGASGKQHHSLSLVGEDQDMLVVNKPAGLPVHPGTGWSDSVTTRLHAMLPDAPFAPTPVHRLDKNTSGILLVAKSYSFLRRMQGYWQQGLVDKIYLAWVLGTWRGSSWTRLTDRLGKSGKPGQETMRVGTGKEASCEVMPFMECSLPPDVLPSFASSPSASLLAVRLHTGRTHQIRVQLASRGFPLIGDPKYNGPPYPFLLLHALKLSWANEQFSVLPSWPDPFSVPTLPAL